MPLLVAVLAGGASLRMGRDKASIPIDGVPMIDRVLNAAHAAGLDTVVVGRRMPVGSRTPGLPDEEPGGGPLAALATVLEAMHREIILVGCDMPLVTSEAFTWLAQQPSFASHGLVVEAHGHLEPLFSRYRPAALPLVRSLLRHHRRSLHALIEQGRFDLVNAPDDVARLVGSINTPEDLNGMGG